MGLPLSGLIMFDCIEQLRHNITGCHLESGYVEIVWEDINDQGDDNGGMVSVSGSIVHWAY
jgi:hypothetical protein